MREAGRKEERGERDWLLAHGDGRGGRRDLGGRNGPYTPDGWCGREGCEEWGEWGNAIQLCEYLSDGCAIFTRTEEIPLIR